MVAHFSVTCFRDQRRQNERKYQELPGKMCCGRFNSIAFFRFSFAAAQTLPDYSKFLADLTRVPK